MKTIPHAACVPLGLWLLGGGAQGIEATEPLGPSSRYTSLVISEIMYHPTNRVDERKLEFVELYNSDPWPQDIGGYTITNLPAGPAYTFPPNTVIAGHGFAVVARHPPDLEFVYGLHGVYGPFTRTNGLPNGRGLIQLRNRAGAILLSVGYSDDPPWPVAADGAGHSLVLSRPSYGENDARAWSASAQLGGSPGGPEPQVAEPLAALRINEFLAHATDGHQDYIELYNYGLAPIDLSGCVITDDPDTNKFVIAPGTWLGPLEHRAWTAAELGFELSALRGRIFVRNGADHRVLDAISYRVQAPDVATGRYPDGTDELYAGLPPTPGQPNPRPPMPELVISEIRYHPIAEWVWPSLEFVELFNPGTNKIFLGGWGFSGSDSLSVDCCFTIRPKEFLAFYEVNLSDSGGRLAIQKPVTVVEPDPVYGELVTNVVRATVDEVSYGTGGRWGRWSDGGGSSLEVIDLHSNRRLAPNWGDSLPPDRTPWILVERTGELSQGAGPCDGVDVMMLGEGEILVDNIEVLTADGQNLVPNSTFETGTQGWTFGGNHERTSWALTEGFESLHALHVRASGRGDPGANRVHAKLSTPLSPGSTVTLRARVRWLRGWPEMLLRLQGNYLEARYLFRLGYGFLEGGTPNAPNSVARSNLGPAIYQVTHSPVVPAAGEDVTVTAAIDDPDGVESVFLYYRRDPGNEWLAVPMNDAGMDGDRIPGDGIYAGRVPGQPSGVLVAFYIEATDGYTPGASQRFPSDAPQRECLVRFDDPSYDNPFGTYRLWMTQATYERWTQRHPLSNEPLDVTFVYGKERVIYNAGALFSGSPETSMHYDTPTGALCTYDVRFPADDRFMGADHIVLDFSSGDPTAQRQQLMHWFAEQLSLPLNHRRYINLFVNGVGQRARRGFGLAGILYEDVQQPNSGMVKQWFEGRSDGSLFKADDWIEFDEAGQIVSTIPPTLEVFLTSRNLKNAARYRWNWRARSRMFPLDPWPPLFELVDGLSGSGEALGKCTDILVDTEQWMRTFALNDLAANWDSFGNVGGKNTYLYKPEGGRWVLFSWDFDTGLGIAGAEPDQPLFEVADPTLARLYQVVPTVRPYWRAIREALQTFYRPEVIGPWLQARYPFLAQMGAASPEPILEFINQRRAFLLGQMPPLAEPFAITSPSQPTFETNRNYLVLRGTAPIEVRTLTVNTQLFPVTWTTVSTWQIAQALLPGMNHLTVEGFDRFGYPIPGASNVVAVRFNGSYESFSENVVLNEALNWPPRCGAEFVELYNRSHTTAFTIPSGFRDPNAVVLLPAMVNPIVLHRATVLAPGAFYITTSDRCAYWAEFGWDAPLGGDDVPRIFDCSEGKPLFPICGVQSRCVIYGSGFPWPSLLPGVSFQLIDPEERPDHAGNWATDPIVQVTPGRTNSVSADLPPFPRLYLNEIVPQNLTGLTDAAGDHDPWLELLNADTNALDLGDLYLSDDVKSLSAWQFPSGASIGPGEYRLVWLDGEPQEATSDEWHTSFRISPRSGRLILSRWVNGRSIYLAHLYYPGAVPQTLPDEAYGLWHLGTSVFRETVRLDEPTPLAPNLYTPPPPSGPSGRPSVRINEWMASNTRIADPADGQFDDWFELYTPYTNSPVDLTGYMLTDDLARTNQFVIPPGYTIPPRGYLLVWADDDVEQSQPDGDLHVNFKLSKKGELIALFYPDGVLADLVQFGQQTNDVSQGRWPDGTKDIYFMTNATPGLPNVRDDLPLCESPRVRVFIAQIGYGVFTVIAFPAEECRGTYVLECKDALEDPEWREVRDSEFHPNWFVEDGRYYHALSHPFVPSARQRFYRVRIKY